MSRPARSPAHLADLAGAPLVRAAVGDVTGVEVTSVTHDSRAVTGGALFCCVRGFSRDGHEFAAEAVARGAVALLVDHRLEVAVPQLVVDDVRVAMGPVAAAAYGNPSHDLTVIGVTGTNGKTTTVHLLGAIFAAAGWGGDVIGTLTGARTTPEAPDLQAQLAELRDAGGRAVAMEVSSHALTLHRVDGTRFAVAVFTNLSPDHLDFHASMEEYFRAKARLFTPELAEQAVVNLDSPHGRLLRDATTIPTVGFSLADAIGIATSPTGSRFRWAGVPVQIALPGRFNVANALAAATAARAVGLDPATIAAGLGAAGPVPGRFELVDAGQPFTVAVDFAHTPEGLRNALDAARDLAGRGRVLVVFGAGGDRDREKRPGLGQAATELADVAVLTNDNPRREDPAAIIDAVRAGCTGAAELVVEPDRRAAIALVIGRARPGDVVVLAGKGHETTQITGDRVVPFDDRVVARELLEELS